MAKVHGAAFAISLRPPMITSRLALMKVSPSHARPRMPMIAVTPDWHVLHFGTSPTGALVTVRMSAATASMTIAIVIGMVSGFFAAGWSSDATGGSSVSPATALNAVAMWAIL